MEGGCAQEFRQRTSQIKPECPSAEYNIIGYNSVSANMHRDT